MTIDNKLKILFGTASVLLLCTLIIKLNYVPGGMILSGLFIGGMLLVGILIGCVVLASILKLIFKFTSFLTLFTITTSVSLLIFHYQLYSPTLKIIVPDNYAGEINLVRSNIEENILVVDSNGIGYLNEWTFKKTYTKPIVERVNGKRIDAELVGYNSSAFWARVKSCCLHGRNIESMSFKILPENSLVAEDYGVKSLTELVDEKLVAF
ncbi:hypothetical protein [Pedobacter sp. GR22-6]|uniref:hypothetical protein n=1 Tax=Pedobacter sp. GR22-6 TaxID=3127957 RepID=UPI00307DDCD2